MPRVEAGLPEKGRPNCSAEACSYPKKRKCDAKGGVHRKRRVEEDRRPAALKKAGKLRKGEDGRAWAPEENRMPRENRQTQGLS